MGQTLRAGMMDVSLREQKQLAEIERLKMELAKPSCWPRPADRPSVFVMSPEMERKVRDFERGPDPGFIDIYFGRGHTGSDNLDHISELEEKYATEQKTVTALRKELAGYEGAPPAFIRTCMKDAKMRQKQAEDDRDVARGQLAAAQAELERWRAKPLDYPPQPGLAPSGCPNVCATCGEVWYAMHVCGLFRPNGGAR